MSQPEGVPEIVQQFLHLKGNAESLSQGSDIDFPVGIDIEYIGNRPHYPISVKLTAGDVLRKSGLFERDDPVHWDLGNYLHVDVSTDINIIVKEPQIPKCLGRKKVYAVFNISSSRVVESEIFSILDEKGNVRIKLTYVRELPTEEFAEMLLKEAEGQLGNKKVFLESLGKAGHVLAALMKFTDLASDVHPAVGAAVIVVNSLYEECKSQQDCHDTAAELMGDLVSFMPFVKDVPPHVVKDDGTRRAIKEMIQLFCRTSKLIIAYSSKGFLGDMLSSHNAEISSAKDEFRKLKEIYDRCVQMEVWMAVNRIEDKTEDGQLQRLHPAERAFYDLEGVCLEGTRESVFERVREWVDSDSKLFWLHGVAGSGKSSIANSVAHMFEKRLFGCFFCKRDDPERRSSKKVLPTLAYHFSKWHRKYRTDILSVIEGKDEPKLSQGLQWQFDLLIKQPLESMSATDAEPPLKPLIVVIDALDECGDEPGSRSQIAEFLVKLAVVVPWLKVFVTSRPLAEFPEVFSKCKTLSISSELDDTQVQDDILRYTRHLAGRLSVQIGEDQIGALVAKASGLFIWTSTVFKYIRDQYDVQEAIEDILSSSAGEHETALVSMYTTVIDSACGGQRKTEIIKTILGIIACTAKYRPLPESAFIHFLSSQGYTFGQNTLTTIINSLQSVLYRDNSRGGAIRVFHPSFLDFINEKSHSKVYWVNPASINSTMATSVTFFLTLSTDS
ncbi:hypothetical protein M0805_001544 [Coniferiporia weirii]|nr:hypothetical protein M0805_001544 [Coniferiporia weirii]